MSYAQDAHRKMCESL